MRSLLLAAALFLGVIPIDEVFEPSGNFDPAHYGKVAVIQWAPDEMTPIGVTPEQAETIKQEHRQALEVYIRQAAARGAEMVVTPEFSIVGYPDIPELPPEEDEYQNPEQLAPYTETVPGPTTAYFGNLARELHVFLHVGFAERDEATGKFYNTIVALNPQGEIAAKYRKMNLYEGERRFLEPGTQPTTYESPFGRVGIMICADVYSRFPAEVYRRAGVNVLALSTSWAQLNTGMSYFTRAAAANRAYMLAANQPYFPDAGVINPDGTTQSHIRQTLGVAYGYLPRRP